MVKQKEKDDDIVINAFYDYFKGQNAIIDETKTGCILSGDDICTLNNSNNNFIQMLKKPNFTRPSTMNTMLPVFVELFNVVFITGVILISRANL